MSEIISKSLQPVWKTILSVDTAKEGSDPSWAVLGAGIENIEEALNEQAKQYFFMDGGGFAHNEVTGMAPTFTLSGRRVYGDPAQDFIEGKKFSSAQGRKTRIKLESECTVGTKTTKTTVTCQATMTVVKTIGGAAIDNSVFNVTFALNGSPTVETA